MSRQLLTNATVVLADEVRQKLAVLIEDGKIGALDPEHTAGATVIDLDEHVLMPGMIDLHCDSLEKEVEPRPGVHFPFDFACAQADKRNASAGITTVFHALSFANREFGVRNNETAAQIGRSIHAWQAHALIDNKFHARFEVTDVTALPILAALTEEGVIDLISFMDHSPGQGQFRDIESFRKYLASVYNADDATLDDIMKQKAEAAKGAIERMQQLAALARKSGVAIASHDDDSAAKVKVVRDLGASISEFPINLEAAQAARDSGIATLFGAPNILRGKSQSGNMRALDAVLAGVADCLCGDYSPASLLPATFKLPELADISLAHAVALVTRNPARAAGLKDRGEIAVGQRADLVAVQRVGGLPHADQVWSRGKLVLGASRVHH
ncbi:alpha-D-ribose 1-methylphosphonate 5-triphosphate diphosphatase [Burkholderia sp. Bp8963]|uniref:alpha-D-ribose 1-methylphosphonate 5-triphosphate diphosphatase n=1 Tax=Burkholderia sp. Bp8963 TaxID=2184547 RepID=UPI000F5984BB|nr:alpha-D-ribose 1-methylphosphonate 5-triphosphate diphosphatase [Burkholderia sp. Bp8963]RQS71143.1 alpha-D-ribose 1-methylphosphonate 5-triphosphate diphosphatase [Burkholderia sp. Bp8963]